MVRSKEFLIQQGMYSGCRDDIYEIIGLVYDDYINQTLTKEDIEEAIREVNSTTLVSSIKKRLKESFPNGGFQKTSSKRTGIYGIYCDNKLVYIGKTIVDFKVRYKQHLYNLQNDNETYLYKKLRQYKEKGAIIQLKPLIVLEDLQLKNKKEISNTELECMELALIISYQPELNIEGRLQPYTFRN